MLDFFKGKKFKLVNGHFVFLRKISTNEDLFY